MKFFDRGVLFSLAALVLIGYVSVVVWGKLGISPSPILHKGDVIDVPASKRGMSCRVDESGIPRTAIQVSAVAIDRVYGVVISKPHGEHDCLSGQEVVLDRKFAVERYKNTPKLTGK